MATDDNIKLAAVSMVKAGIMTFAQAAEMAGTSRQLVRYWANGAGISDDDATEVRKRYLADQWRKALKSAKLDA